MGRIKGFWYTFFLNLLFILLLPIVIFRDFNNGWLVLAAYWLIYSEIEYLIDIKLQNKDYSHFSCFINMLFNLALLIGVSALIFVTLSSNCLFITLLIIVAFIYWMSLIEEKIDRRLK